MLSYFFFTLLRSEDTFFYYLRCVFNSILIICSHQHKNQMAQLKLQQPKNITHNKEKITYRNLCSFSLSLYFSLSLVLARWIFVACCFCIFLPTTLIPSSILQKFRVENWTRRTITHQLNTGQTRTCQKKRPKHTKWPKKKFRPNITNTTTRTEKKRSKFTTFLLFNSIQDLLVGILNTFYNGNANAFSLSQSIAASFFLSTKVCRRSDTIESIIN